MIPNRNRKIPYSTEINHLFWEYYGKLNNTVNQVWSLTKHPCWSLICVIFVMLMAPDNVIMARDSVIVACGDVVKKHDDVIMAYNDDAIWAPVNIIIVHNYSTDT